MDEVTNLVARDRHSAGQFELLPPHLLSPALDMLPREPHLLDYLMILRKRQWLILFFLLTVVTIVTIATFRMQPVYRASAKLEIGRENANILPFQGMQTYDMYLDSESYIETQAKILVSATLALQTIQSTGIAELPEFGGQPGQTPKLTLPDGSIANQEPPPALGAFLGRLNVKRVPNSRLMEVSLESTSPRLAARVLNAHLDDYIEQNFRSKYEATTQASKWLASQLNELRIKVEKSEDARIGYERQNQIWTIDEKQNITTQKLAELNKELTDAQADRMRREALYQLASSGNFDSLPAIRDNEMVQGLLKEQNKLNAEYADALNQYGPNFPRVARMKAQMKELEDLVVREKKNVVNRIEADYRTARQRELLLNQIGRAHV